MPAFFQQHSKDNAPGPWNTSMVSEAVASSICYLPIMDNKVQDIVISDTGEELIDLSLVKNPRIRPLSAFDQRYHSGHEEHSKIRKGFFEQLLKMLNFLPPHLGIAYFEGLRPLQKQKEYFDKKFKEMLKQGIDPEKAYQETCKYVSPFIENIPVHATGAALDMTLFSEQNGKLELLDMGQFGTIFGSNPHQETFSSNTTESQRENRLILLNAAAKAKLVNYGYEWWHFCYKDKMWAFVNNQQAAQYGLAAKQDKLTLVTKKNYIESMLEEFKNQKIVSKL